MTPGSLHALASVPIAAPQPASDRISDVLREQIIAGSLTSGVRLTEEVVAEHLDASRNTIREAFLILAAEGLVVRRAHRGVFVADATPELVTDLYAVRLLIEPAALLWGTVTPAALASMREACERASEAVASGSIRAMRSANQDFHRAIVALTGSERTQRWFCTCLAEMWLAFNAIGEQRDFHTPYVARNRDILTLLEAGRREDAADALRTYLQDARADLLGRLASVRS